MSVSRHVFNAVEHDDLSVKRHIERCLQGDGALRKKEEYRYKHTQGYITYEEPSLVAYAAYVMIQ